MFTRTVNSIQNTSIIQPIQMYNAYTLLLYKNNATYKHGPAIFGNTMGAILNGAGIKFANII